MQTMTVIQEINNQRHSGEAIRHKTNITKWLKLFFISDHAKWKQVNSDQKSEIGQLDKKTKRKAKKDGPPMCCLWDTQIRSYDTHRSKMKENEIFHTNSNKKGNHTNTFIKKVIRDKEIIY